MANPELIESWRVTAGHLQTALSALSAECRHDQGVALQEYAHFLERNELELAYDALEAAIVACADAPVAAMKSLLLAAKNMGLEQKAHRMAKVMGQRQM